MERGSGGYAGEAPRPTEFYHGTSLEAILAIQATGFRVDLAGTNAGAALGAGVYVTTTLEKALNYAKGVASSPNPADGGVFQLRVDLGRCYTVRSGDRGERKGWAERGYDSAWAAEGIIGAREENCVRDPARVGIVNVVLGNTAAAGRLGYEVRNGRLEMVDCAAAEGVPPMAATERSERAAEELALAAKPVAPGAAPTVGLLLESLEAKTEAERRLQAATQALKAAARRLADAEQAQATARSRRVPAAAAEGRLADARAAIDTTQAALAADEHAKTLAVAAAETRLTDARAATSAAQKAIDEAEAKCCSSPSVSVRGASDRAGAEFRAAQDAHTNERVRHENLSRSRSHKRERRGPPTTASEASGTLPT